MNYYIALGGLGCRGLKEYARNHAACQCYYIDTDPSTAHALDPEDRFFCVQTLHYGTGAFRQIGKNATKLDIYSGKLSAFFEDIHRAVFADITILTSSFGGFGSAAAIEILDLLEYMLFEKPEQNRGKHCRILAFSEGAIAPIGLPPSLTETYKANTLEMLGDMASRKGNDASRAFIQRTGRLFNPECTFYLLDPEKLDFSRIAGYLQLDDAQLRRLDVQNRYALKGKKASHPVFISYSSKDQAIADLLVSTLEQHNISSWIATKDIQEGSYAKQIIQGIRNAKIFIVLLSKNSIASEQVKNEIDRAFSRIAYGLKIVPFIIDDAQLDDECSYYLCRQEFYFGKEPPLAERIREFAERVADMLE